MTSLAPLENDQNFSSGATAARDKVDASELDAQLAAIKNWANNLNEILGGIIRDDDTLADGIVRLRNLHAEVIAALNGIGGSVDFDPETFREALELGTAALDDSTDFDAAGTAAAVSAALTAALAALTASLGTAAYVNTTAFDAAGAAAAAQAAAIAASQPLNAKLTAMSGLTAAADTVGYFTGVGAMAVTALTSLGRALIGGATAAAMLGTLGITASVAELNYSAGVTSAIQTQLDGKQTLNANLTAIAGLTSASNKITRWTGSGTAGLLDYSTDGTFAGNSDTIIASQKAIKTYVDNAFAANDAMVFKGTIDASTNPNYPAADAGHTYRFSVAGKIGGASGINVEINDTAYCIVDGTLAGTQAGVGASWVIIQSNLDGAVIGPASVTDSNFAQFDGTTGKLIKGGLSLDTDGTLSANSATRVPSQSAVVTYAQPKDATLTALAGLATGADKLAYSSGTDTFAQTDLTSVARTLIGQATQALMRTTGLGSTTVGDALFIATDAAAGRTALALGSMAIQAAGAVAITGGTINATTIGATTATTGAFTTLSATGVITSTLATGTAPFTVASTTVVGNLNVSQLLGSTWAAPAALGSGSPAAVTGTTITATVGFTCPLLGTSNESFGSGAGVALIAGGTQNCFFGKSAGNAVTTGDDNIAFGKDALLLATTPSGNVAIGTSAMAAVTTSDTQSIGIGYQALKLLTTSTSIVAIGYQALATGTTGIGGSVAVGYQALKLATGGANTAMGYLALTANTSGADNIAIGNSALVANQTGNSNIAIGDSALSVGAANSDNIAIGTNALLGGTSATPSQSVGIGTNVMQAITSGGQNVGVGYKALQSLTTAASVVAIGSQAGTKITSGGTSIAIGELALGEAQTVTGNTAIGKSALGKFRSSNNTVVGDSSWTGSATAANNTGATNTSVGAGCGGTSITTATENSFLGYGIAIGLTTGAYNTALGKSALSGLTSGSGNIGLGAYAGYAHTTGSNTLYIGDTSQHATNYAIDTITIASSNAGGPNVTNAMRWAGVQTFNAAVIYTPVTLTDAATITVNAALGNRFRITLTASGHTLGSPSNGVDGQVITFEITQDGTGSRTMLYHADYNMTTDYPAGTLSTTAGKTDIRSFVKIGSIWRAISPLALNN